MRNSKRKLLSKGIISFLLKIFAIKLFKNEVVMERSCIQCRYRQFIPLAILKFLNFLNDKSLLIPIVLIKELQ